MQTHAAAGLPPPALIQDTPRTNIEEMALQGVSVFKVNGYIDDCGAIVKNGLAEVGWFDTSTLKEPYRIEGKKTMGLELAEQFGFDALPDVILYAAPPPDDDDDATHRAERGRR